MVVYHSVPQNQDHRMEIELIPFEIISKDYAGSVYYKTQKKSELKAYILLFSSGLTRAVHT